MILFISLPSLSRSTISSSVLVPASSLPTKRMVSAVFSTISIVSLFPIRFLHVRVTRKTGIGVPSSKRVPATTICCSIELSETADHMMLTRIRQRIKPIHRFIFPTPPLIRSPTGLTKNGFSLIHYIHILSGIPVYTLLTFLNILVIFCVILLISILSWFG